MMDDVEYGIAWAFGRLVGSGRAVDVYVVS